MKEGGCDAEEEQAMVLLTFQVNKRERETGGLRGNMRITNRESVFLSSGTVSR